MKGEDTYLGIAGGDAAEAGRHGAGHRVRAGLHVAQQRSGVAAQVLLLLLMLLLLKVLVLEVLGRVHGRRGRRALHGHGHEVVEGCLGAAETAARRGLQLGTTPEGLVQVLPHLVLLLLDHVVARGVLQQRPHLPERIQI